MKIRSKLVVSVGDRLLGFSRDCEGFHWVFEVVSILDYGEAKVCVCVSIDTGPQDPLAVCFNEEGNSCGKHLNTWWVSGRSRSTRSLFQTART